MSFLSTVRKLYKPPDTGSDQYFTGKLEFTFLLTVAGRYKTCTDSGLDYGMDYGLSWAVDSLHIMKREQNYTSTFSNFTF